MANKQPVENDPKKLRSQLKEAKETNLWKETEMTELRTENRILVGKLAVYEKIVEQFLKRLNVTTSA